MAVVTFYPSANTGDWTNGGNTYGNDGVYAQCIPAKYATITHYVYDFGFNIPNGSTINSITLSVERKLSTTGSNGSFYFSALKNNTVVGTEFVTSLEPTTDTVYSTTAVGTWSVSELNAGGDTGFKVYFKEYRGSSSTTKVAYVDFVSVTVDYTEPPPALSSRRFAQII